MPRIYEAMGKAARSWPLSSYLLVPGIMRSLATWLQVGVKNLKLFLLWFYGTWLLRFHRPLLIRPVSFSSTRSHSWAKPLDQTLLVWIQTASGKLRCGCPHRGSHTLSGPNFALKHLMHFKKGFSSRLKQADGLSNSSKTLAGVHFPPLSRKSSRLSSFSPTCLCTV